jgi:hypothetical protein
VPKSRSIKTRRKAGQAAKPKISLPTATNVPESPLSLPPAADADTAPVASVAPSTEVDKSASWYLPPNSVIREKAIKIVAMRAGGFKPSEIAAALNIKESNIRPYVWRASKNGWIDFDDPADSLEFRLLPKVMKNLDEALDDHTRHMTSGVKVKDALSVEIAKGTIFKRFDQGVGVAPQTIVAVKIEMPEGPRPQVRDGNEVGGVPAHIIDAEMADGVR